MSPAIIVPLIAFGGVIVTQIFGLVINRMNANDLRSNIDRDIDIIRRLDPDAAVTRRLAAHVRNNIYTVISRDKRRSRVMPGLRKSFIGFAITAAVLVLDSWRDHHPPGDVKDKIDIVFWPLFVLMFIVAASVLLDTWRITRPSAVDAFKRVFRK